MEISINEKTKKRLEYLQSLDDGKYPRIFTVAYDCGGPVIDIKYEEPREIDKIIESDNIKFAIESSIITGFKRLSVTYNSILSSFLRREIFSVSAN